MSGYTNPNQIKRRRAMAQSMMSNQRRKAPIENILKALGAYQGGRFAAADEAANDELKKKEMSALVSTLKTGHAPLDGVGPLKEGVTQDFQHPDVQGLVANNELAKAMQTHKSQNPTNPMQQRTPATLQIFRSMTGRENPKSPEDAALMYRIHRSIQVKDTGDSMEEVNMPDFSRLFPKNETPQNASQAADKPNQSIVDELATTNSIDGLLSAASSPQANTVPLVEATKTPAPQQPAAFNANLGKPKSLAPKEKIDYVSEAEKAKEKVRIWGKQEEFKQTKINDRPKVRAGLRGATDQHQTIRNNAEEALALADGWTVGMMGNLGGIPLGHPAYDLAQKLLTVKANIGFISLQEMRANSPTGGALGQVSDVENRLLQATWGSLAQAQSPEEFRKAMQSVLERSDAMMNSQYELYQDMYGEAFDYKSPLNKKEKQFADDDMSEAALKHRLGL